MGKPNNELTLYACKIPLTVRSSVLVNGTVQLMVIPPAVFCLNTTSGGCRFSRIPISSSSCSSCCRCSSPLVTSNMMQTRSAVLATATT